MKEKGIIFCPPLSDYPTESHCELIGCPHCGQKMWFSEKKKVIKQEWEARNLDIFIACYPCFLRIMSQKLIDGEIKSLDEFIKVDL